MRRTLIRALLRVLAILLTPWEGEDRARIVAKPLGLEEVYWRDPIQNPQIAPDEPGTVILWKLNGDGSDARRDDFSAALTRAFVQHLGHEPRAMHIVLDDETDLQTLTKAQFENKIAPWLK